MPTTTPPDRNPASRRASRNILVFSDGTGNSSGKLQRTNVWRVYQAVDLADPQTPGIPRQFAFYDNGVGTSSFKPLALLGGAFGFGLARNVRDLYAFVCRTYQTDAEIYAFGFSRGAFTIRVLIGLMMSQGLVPYNGSEADLKRNVAAAYRAYRRDRFNQTGGLVGPLRALRDRIITLGNRLLKRPNYDRSKQIRLPRVKFVGVWDTVAAYGLPVDELTRAIDDYVWPLSMPDRNLSDRVECALHALSIDDERNTFHPQLWNEQHPSGAPGASGGDQPRGEGGANRELLQVWFAGAHSDVGGGYPDNGVSYVSLNWIMSKAHAKGVQFQDPIWDEYKALSDENGPINDSRKGLAGYYRYNPRRIEKIAHKDGVIINKIKVHESVIRRIQVGQDAYSPIILPSDFDIIKINGTIVPNDAYLMTLPNSGNSQLAPSGQGSAFPRTWYAKHRDNVFNLVWWRRITYFFTLFSTLVLLAMPLWSTATPKTCTSGLCFVSEMFDPLRAVLPGFTSAWLDAFASHPGSFIGLAAAVIVGLGLGSSLETSIKDGMRRIWYRLPATTPNSIQPSPSPADPGPINTTVRRIRTSKLYTDAMLFLTHRAMPLAFLAASGYLVLCFVTQSIFTIRESEGGVCIAPDHAAAITEQSKPFRFVLSETCAATGFRVDEGATYRLSFFVPSQDQWIDASLAADPRSAAPVAAPLRSLGVPLRRHLAEPWFKPFARIGSKGTDFYPLHLDPQVARRGGPEDVDLPTCEGTLPDRPSFTSRLVARTTGELFLYVNDAVGFPPFSGYFYANNKGSACVVVERLHPKPLGRTSQLPSPP